MTQSPQQNPASNATNEPNKAPEKKVWSQPQTDADKKAQADKAQPQGNCSSKS